MGESEQGSGNSMTTGRQEEDEMLARMEEDKNLLDESGGDDKQPTTRPKEKATHAGRGSSVGTLAKNFMKNVQVGANEVFAASAPRTRQQRCKVRLKQGSRHCRHRASKGASARI